MKNVLILGACIAVAAFAASASEVLPYLTGPANGTGSGGHWGSDAILVDNLITSGSQVTNGLAGCTYFSSWLAFDYTPTASVTVRQITMDYLYNSSPLKGDLNFRLYSGANPSVGSILSTWGVPAAGFQEVNTGWTAFSRSIYRATIPIPDKTLSPSTKYWFAYTSTNSLGPNIVYWCVWGVPKELEVWWYLNGFWGPGSSQGAGGSYDQSYRLEDSQSGVAPASLGKIKTLFQ